MLGDYLPLIIFLALAVLVGGAVSGLFNLLGPRKPSKAKGLPYECGIVPAEAARRRFSVTFYLTAMLFIIFDVEAVFLYPWAVDLGRTLHVFGLIEMLVFVALLGVALLFVWRKGALEWD
ncbi:MAG TPA: NADH-quinone oxidoreductase subunit A [Candidatus Micrarchaeia archaeon]|nr:NADH-quinone oxidoreductase subunit A [Candidatus Micrarchaeia archaeon]